MRSAYSSLPGYSKQQFNNQIRANINDSMNLYYAWFSDMDVLMKALIQIQQNTHPVFVDEAEQRLIMYHIAARKLLIRFKEPNPMQLITKQIMFRFDIIFGEAVCAYEEHIPFSETTLLELKSCMAYMKKTLGR